MSANNGNRSRFNITRKRRIARAIQIRSLKATARQQVRGAGRAQSRRRKKERRNLPKRRKRTNLNGSSAV